MLFQKKNKRTEFTRICVAEALLSLLKTRHLNQIKVSSIVAKAGVSRMTFYNYFSSPMDVLKDYLNILIDDYVKKCADNTSIGKLGEYSHILFSLQYFDEYKDYFIIMKENGMHNIILDAMNDFLVSSDLPFKSEYKMRFFSGGMLNVFLSWETDNQGRSASDIADIVSHFLESI